MNDSNYTTTFDLYLPTKEGGEARLAETLEVEVYQNFGQEMLTPESSALIEERRAYHLGRVTGMQVKALRKRFNLTQSVLADLLNCGKKSLSRWENGKDYPSGIVSRLLRLLEDGIISVADLKSVAGTREVEMEHSFFKNRATTAASRNVIHYDFSSIGPIDEEPEELEELELAANE